MISRLSRIPHLQIRRARESEAAQLSALAIAAKRRWNYSDLQIEMWRAELEISAFAVAMRPTFVAEVDGRIVGFYSLMAAPGEWELDNLWVLPDFNRQGIGRTLLEHAKIVAADGGAVDIAIDADPNAESFYLACGAQRVAVVAAPIRGDPDRVRPQLNLPVRKI